MVEKDRRHFLRKTGVASLSFVGVGSLATNAGAKKDKNKRKVPEDKLIEKYGGEEAKIALRIRDKYVKKMDKGKISKEEAHEEIYNNILSHPKLDKFSKDIKESRAKRKRSKNLENNKNKKR